jgi:large subunit ribosomal protein L15
VSERFEGGQMPMHMRMPKLRGFKNPFRTEYQVVNLARLQDLFPEGGKVTVADLVDKGAVRAGHPVKVLGTGEISAKVDVQADKFSASAKEKIEAAGGSVTALAGSE